MADVGLVSLPIVRPVLGDNGRTTGEHWARSTPTEYLKLRKYSDGARVL